ncbi:hypothetical protein BHE74_00014512 [Ensete ventricosum]|nr:hypothetical protein GW17_00051342 [Ensete ventricosum]RWW77334.1 hypothetical protein BHE74_00014512 [Ensete ventricosum]
MASVLTPSATVRPIAGGFASPLPSRLTPTKVHYDPQPLRSMKKSKKNAAASQSSRLPLLPTVITPNLRVRSSFSFVPLLFSPSSCSSFLNFLPLRAKLRPQAQGADYSPPSPSPSDDATEDAFSWSSVFLPFLFPALGGLLFGYDIGATSGASISIQVSGSLYGALAGSLIAYPTSDFLGRRRELIAAAALYLVGGLVTGCAPDLVVLIIGRLIYGIGIGMLGYLVGSVEITAVGGWRYMYGLSAPIALVMALGMWTLPPSPRWLLLRAVQGKGALEDYKEKALNALAKLRGRPAGDKISERQIDETLVSLKAAYAEEESEGSVLEVSFGPISWLMVSEIFPLRTRGRGISLAVLTNFGSNALVTFAFSPLKELVGPANIFLLFGAIALLSLAFVYFYVPETKGLSLEEIENKILN